MQQYIKKYFWAVNVVAVVVCAVFAGRAAMHYVEAKALAEDPSPPEVKQPTVRRKAPVKTRTKRGEPLAKRNMFCATCEPPEPEQQDDQEGVDPDTPTVTSLPLELIATNVSTKQNLSFATIQNTETSLLGAYSVDDAIPDAGPIVEISARYVDFRNGRRLERILLDSEKKATRKKRTPTKPKSPGRNSRNALSAELDDGIKKVGDNSYEVERSLVEKIISNPAAIRGARIVPSIRNGKADGFKLYAIRPSSAFAKIGLQNGDTIHSINGFDLSSPDKALEVYTKVREANNISVTVTRRGKPVTMTYSIQ